MFFECIFGSGGGGFVLTVTCASQFAGTTITCSDGTTTLTGTCPSTSPYTIEFAIPNGGIWTVSGVYAGTPISESVTIEDSVTLNATPEGSTVTPTDDISIWLHCANIWDKTYTTINQVLSDTTTLLALISSNNAADYMARSTTWASSVCANSTAMSYIGNNNYCASKLLGVSTWRTAISDSSYYQSVLTSKVPTMTSDTTPSGQAIGYNINSNLPAYHSFDNNSTTYTDMHSSDANNVGAVGYMFTSAVDITKFDLQVYNISGYFSKGFKVQYSDNGTSWSDITDSSYVTNSSGTSKSYIVKNNVGKHKYWRLYFNNGGQTSGGLYYMATIALQFYGRA